MDRRDFFKTMLATPLLTPLILSSKKTTHDLELYLIAENPQLFLSTLLEKIQEYSSTGGRKFAFLNSHPNEKSIKKSLLQKGWRFVQEPVSANLVLSFSHLHHKALPSFTLVREGRIWDIRSQKLFLLWREMNENHELSSCLTMVSFKNRPSDHLAGEFVSVYKEGRKLATLPLKENVKRSFKTQTGNITAHIRNGSAWVAESSCRHKICLHSPPVSLAGERIICAPNHFFLEIGRSSSIDTVIG